MAKSKIHPSAPPPSNVTPIRAGLEPPKSAPPPARPPRKGRRADPNREQLEARVEDQRMRLYRAKNLVGVTRFQLSEGADGASISIEDCEGTLESAEEVLEEVLEALDVVTLFRPEKEARS
jgi:hypothetical protein